MAVAIIYGFQPNLLFDIQLNSTDEYDMYKATMGLYLAFTSFWLYALFYKDYWRTATISNVLFMFGLVIGRLISLVIDGMPSALFVFGFFGELVLAIYGIYLLKINRQQ